MLSYGKSFLGLGYGFWISNDLTSDEDWSGLQRKKDPQIVVGGSVWKTHSI